MRTEENTAAYAPPGPGRSPGSAAPPRDAPEQAVRGLSDALFGSFPRRDQRRKGELYLRGLLLAEGRKTIRNIGAHVGGAGMEQSLHHFISSSTWDWMPVRRALAGYVRTVSSPHLWVVQPMPIPKAGDRSVGVHEDVDPGTEKAFHGQRAFGLWHVSDALDVPVHWRLYLPEPWLRDPARRCRAEIPDEAPEETWEQCAAATVLRPMADWRLAPRPVVLNAPVDRIADTLGRFTAAGVPVVARVSGTAPLTVRDPALARHAGRTYGAQQILALAKGLRRRVDRPGPAGSPGIHGTSWAVGVRVGTAGRFAGPGQTGPGDGTGSAGACGSGIPGGNGGNLLLLGELEEPRLQPTRCWITNMEAFPVRSLLRVTDLAGRVGRALDGTGEGVGLKDFDGRSFRGWHRHVTLASAAHAATSLAGTVVPWG
ncbi:IS701 family transposase [Actinacidiphila reveromycinica]|uniref:IS701 family transposase n=1 Tax=Actinacidiphila reveromycinica TaxID=659352 RepID=UPI003D2689D9